MAQFERITDIETHVRALVLPVVVEIMGRGDLSGKICRAVWRTLLSPEIEFELTTVGAFVIAATSTITISPAGSSIMQDTPGEAGKRATWGDMPAGDYAFKLYAGEPGEEPAFGVSALWRHRAPQHAP